MTKVQIRFTLLQPLDETMLRRIGDAQAIYGIDRIMPNQALDGLMVEFDATRLCAGEVEATLERAGIRVERAH